MNQELLLKLLIFLPSLLLAVSFHEAAHAWSADRLGDSTARLEGRVTLNPLRHIDLVQSVLVPILLILTLGFAFGSAKPVPVVTSNLNNPRRDSALVSAAGPASNLLLAFGAAVMMRFLVALPEAGEFFTKPLFHLCNGLVLINVILAVFNMIPIPPLDGSGVVAAFLPEDWADRYLAIGQFGFLILILLIFDPLQIGFWEKGVQPFVLALNNLYMMIAGLA